MKIITIKDKKFVLSISSANIQSKVKVIARRINKDMKKQSPVFIAVLNGSFMFASDLMKNISIASEISFVKIASYSGTLRNENADILMGLNIDIENRNVIILEDIVDSGNTLALVCNLIKKKNPAQLKIASLLFKPTAYKANIPLDYVGMEVPDNFLVGYGLDYNGEGRNLKDIYVLK